jgi:membrane-associated protease RseP (regulator of RpoE activity)
MRWSALAAFLVASASPLSAQQPQPGRAAPAAWIGVTYDLRWLEDRAGCASRVVIASVAPGAPAALAGLRAGDSVLAVGGDRRPADRLPILTSTLAPGDSVRLLIDRAGVTRQVTVRADRRPERTALAMPMPARGMPSDGGPLVRLVGGALIASDLPLWRDRTPSGYWLETPEGGLAYRSLGARRSTDLDRRAARLLACADSADRSLRPAAARFDRPVAIEQIQQRAESLRVVIARRANESSAAPSRPHAAREFVPAELPRSPARLPAPTGLRAEEAAIAGLRALVLRAEERRDVAGAELFTVEPELGRHFGGVNTGLLVLRVAPGTAADLSGLRPGDIITSAAGAHIVSAADLRAVLEGPGSDAVELTILRHGNRGTVRLGRP